MRSPFFFFFPTRGISCGIFTRFYSHPLHWCYYFHTVLTCGVVFGIHLFVAALSHFVLSMFCYSVLSVQWMLFNLIFYFQPTLLVFSKTPLKLCNKQINSSKMSTFFSLPFIQAVKIKRCLLIFGFLNETISVSSRVSGDFNVVFPLCSFSCSVPVTSKQALRLRLRPPFPCSFLILSYLLPLQRCGLQRYLMLIVHMKENLYEVRAWGTDGASWGQPPFSSPSSQTVYSPASS